MIKEIELMHWRSHQESHYTFVAPVTNIVGPNGSGKTSILEGISTLAHMKSWKTSKRALAISRGETYARVDLRGDGLNQSMRLERKGQESLQSNAKFLIEGVGRGAVEYLSQSRIAAVSFCPEDLDIWRLGPGLRRAWLNRFMIQRSPHALEALWRYQWALKERNTLLRQGVKPDDRQVQIYTREVARFGSVLQRERREAIDELNRGLMGMSQEYLPEASLELRYEPSLIGGEQEEGYLEILMRLEERSKNEVYRTEYGIHRDDVCYLYDGVEVEQVSRGELRIAMLLMRCSELELLEHPGKVLLLDDYGAELDEQRRGLLNTILQKLKVQCFSTGTERYLEGESIILQ